MIPVLALMIVSTIIAVGCWFSATSAKGSAHWRARFSIFFGVVALLSGMSFLYFRSFWAGQGHAVEHAKIWSEKWRPGSSVECQSYDTDGNRYISCTVGWKKADGATDVEAIECGVDLWFYGWRSEGCRLMKGFSGSQ